MKRSRDGRSWRQSIVALTIVTSKSRGWKKEAKTKLQR